MSRTRAYVGMYGNVILTNVVEGWIAIAFALLALIHLFLLFKADDE